MKGGRYNISNRAEVFKFFSKWLLEDCDFLPFDIKDERLSFIFFHYFDQ